MVTYLMVSHGEYSINSRVKKLLMLVRQYGRGVLVCTGKDRIDADCVSIKPYPNPTGILRIIGLSAVKRTVDKYLFFPSRNILYVHKAIKNLENLISQDMQANKQVLLITCVPHHDICLAGLHLKRRYPALKWIIDWQDLWSYDESYFHRVPAIYRRRLLELEQKMLKTADVNVTTNDYARKVLIDKYGVSSQKIVAINHCFSEEDYNFHDGAGQEKVDSGGPEAIKIGFLGNMFKPPKVPGEKLIDSIRAVRNKGSNVELHIYGDTSSTAKSISEGNEETWLIFHDRMPHQESLRVISQCHFLVLLLEDLPNCRAIVHQKLPHYLRIGKPILAIVPEDSAVAQIIRETKAGYVIPSADDWGPSLERIFLDYQNGLAHPEREKEAIAGFSWENSALIKWRALIQGVWQQDMG